MGRYVLALLLTWLAANIAAPLMGANWREQPRHWERDNYERRRQVFALFRAFRKERR